MSKLLVFGHQNPDTDTIASAIALSYLLNEVSIEAEAVALGEPNEETKFVLDYFRVDAPRIIETASNEVDEVVLVDHNESQQSVSDISKVTIKAVVDHHRIANFETNDPLFYRAEPVGSTATILLKIFKEHEVAIPSEIAGLMLSAIVSDTLLLKSPTSTSEDVLAAEELAEIAGVSLDEYGLDMLKAGTDISSKTPEDILNDDAKSFPMGRELVRIGQVNVVDVNDVLTRKAEILEAMRKETRENNYDLYVLLITDIIENNSVAIVDGPAYRQFEMAFSKPIQLNMVDLDGVVSRKKQVVPPLTEIFKKEY
ncbi:manganese-dependent inorganic pyrophosphatase [Carnobacteriaceae bacterium 52-44]